MSSIAHQRHSLMFRPRTYMAFAVAPQPPIMDWLSALDVSLERSESFFAGQHVALDLSAVNLSSTAIGQLVANLEERNIRILGIEGVDPAKWQVGLPPSFAAAAACESQSRRRLSLPSHWLPRSPLRRRRISSQHR